MDNRTIIEEMLEILTKSGVTIRTEQTGGGGGGLCKIKEKYVFFFDPQAPDAQLLELCAQAVMITTDIESIYIKPQVRNILEKYKNNTS